ILHEPALPVRIGWFVASNPVALVPLVAFVVMFGLWYVKGRDPDPGISVAPLYEPPAQLSPAELGTLVDDKVDPRDITSTLIDLAVRGYLQIEEVANEGFFTKHKDYIFHLLKPMEEWPKLAAHERIMLEKIFGPGGQQTKLSDLKEHFYTALPMIRDEIMRSLKRRGMYTVDPKSAAGYMFLGILAIVGVSLLLQYAAGVSLFVSGVVAFVSLAVAAGIVLIFGRLLTAKSLLGMRTYVGVLGFQEFMTRVEADRLKRMPPDTFEKFLPYAMALGVEQRWAKAFAGIIQDPPRWYTSPGGAPPTGFNPIFFTNSMR